MEEYISKLKELLSVDNSNIELVSQSNNVVFRVESREYGIVYAKFYLNNSTHIDNEMCLYDLLDNKYLKEVVMSIDEPKLAIFKELKGKTLDELSIEELKDNKEKIIDSVITFYESLRNKKINNYGLLDKNMNGTSTNFEEFIINRQSDTERVLESYPVLNSAFTNIYNKYKDLIVGDNCLVPIDTNLKNIMLTEDGNIKFIDPGELISAPVLMGYGDFVAHIYKTELYDLLISKLNLSSDDLKKLRIYAVFSSLNILAFLKKLGVEDLTSVIPYGNTYTFYDMINEHLDNLKVEKTKKI